MSFINLLSNDIWSDQDITRRTESMVHAEFSLEEENILHRKVTGSISGLYELSLEEQQQLARYTEICEIAKQEGIAARNDMTLLLNVFEVEKAKERLSLPVVEPVLDEEGNITNQEEIDNDIQERNDAQITIDNATEEELQLIELRKPVIEVPEEIVSEANTIEPQIE